MGIKIENMDLTYFDAILDMNNAAQPEIIPLSSHELQQLYEVADYFKVAFYDDELAGFIVALEPDKQHTSPNYRWFQQHYDDFVYIDRVVVAKGHRRHGIGRVLYADVQSYAEKRAPILTTEINLEPADQVSMLFHGTYGFTEVGRLTLEAHKRTVSLLSKPLPAHEFILANYGKLAP